MSAIFPTEPGRRSESDRALPARRGPGGSRTWG